MKQLSKARQLELLEDFALALQDGLSPLQATAQLARHAQTQNLRGERQFAQQVASALQRGEPLAAALTPFINADLLMLVDVGERSGQLPQLLARYGAAQLQRSQALQQFIRPLLYPAIMLFIAVLAVFFIGQTVLPKLATNLPISAWPELAQALYWLSQPLLVTAVLLALLLLLIWVCGVPSGALQRLSSYQWLVNYGAFRVQRYFIAVELLQTLTVLLAAQVNLNRAVNAMQIRAGGLLARACRLIQSRLNNGEKELAQLLNVGLLAPRMLFRLANASRSATEQATLARVAGYAANDAVASLARLRQGLQSFCYLMIFSCLGVAVGGMGTMLMQLTQQTQLV
ncbi:type II secretion system F family protein [Pseudidiomarina taiwanensis]|uniref:Type II secretion system protein GspF domain-containing protein n=1 Tax=Pseudidiomarina taiwanensis TaxID=337250 RepID=A0A432ZJZ4_9GAMM|nr:type II secretion system F family protein [Pseudidiomarina taiwanensis]RUO78259.1 hypothetical protein CWI83_04295 [Pseudidiomarina taiwanensis]